MRSIRDMEQLLKQKGNQAQVPKLTFDAAADAETDLSALIPGSLRRARRLNTRIIAMACVAVIAIAGSTIFALPLWQNIFYTVAENSALEVSNLPNSLADASKPTADSSKLETNAQLLKRLAGYIPHIPMKYLYITDNGRDLEGYFTNKDIVERAHLCLYFNEGTNEIPRYLLFIETLNGVLIKEFSYNEPMPISNISMQDLTGDGLDELIVAVTSGGSNRGVLLYIITMVSDTPRILFTINSADSTYDDEAPPPFDFGFVYEFLPNYQAVLKNKSVATEHDIDLSYMKELTGFDGSFDSNGRGTQSLGFDWVYRYELTDIDKDGLCEIRCVADVWYSTHAETVGYVSAYLKYNTASHEFKVIRTDYTPLIQQNND